jgi:hypothetical protein
MPETQPAQPLDRPGEERPPEKPAVKIHRVCIGCNNMFEVTMDHYEAKHCPSCHKV